MQCIRPCYILHLFELFSLFIVTPCHIMLATRNHADPDERVNAVEAGTRTLLKLSLSVQIWKYALSFSPIFLPPIWVSRASRPVMSRAPGAMLMMRTSQAMKWRSPRDWCEHDLAYRPRPGQLTTWSPRRYGPLINSSALSRAAGSSSDQTLLLASKNASVVLGSTSPK